jgi:hypothetical protein
MRNIINLMNNKKIKRNLYNNIYTQIIKIFNKIKFYLNVIIKKYKLGKSLIGIILMNKNNKKYCSTQ